MLIARERLRRSRPAKFVDSAATARPSIQADAERQIELAIRQGNTSWSHYWSADGGATDHLRRCKIMELVDHKEHTIVCLPFGVPAIRTVFLLPGIGRSGDLRRLSRALVIMELH
uniref:Uncharacterized protein n=1 Tax=Trichuris muris TaxID=70415 RepID=A0A5S6Q7X1_TRIMR